MITLHFKSNLGLGDSLMHAQWMRRVQATYGFRMVYYVPEHHRWQLTGMAHGCDIHFEPLGYASHEAVQAPYDGPDRACGADTNDFVAVKLNQYAKTASLLGFESPVAAREQWLFDSPEIVQSDARPVDFFVVNAEPVSWGRSVDLTGMDDLIGRLVAAGHSVICTNPNPHVPVDMAAGVLEKAAAGLRARNIICVATGPCWPTFNTVTEASVERRMIICHERVSFGREWPHFRSVEAVKSHLLEQQLIR